MNPVQTSGRPRAVELVPMTLAWRAEAAQAAAADHHTLIAPTHAVVKDGRVIGYASCGAVPMFFAWMDRQHATARDSFTAWQLAEQELAAQHTHCCMPCEATSPFAPFLAKRGYQILGTAQMCLKTLERK